MKLLGYEFKKFFQNHRIAIVLLLGIALLSLIFVYLGFSNMKMDANAASNYLEENVKVSGAPKDFEINIGPSSNQVQLSTLLSGALTFGLMALGVIGTILILGPLAVAVFTYIKDINGDRAIFESHLPYSGVARILAKLAVAATTMILGFLATASLMYATLEAVSSGLNRSTGTDILAKLRQGYYENFNVLEFCKFGGLFILGMISILIFAMVAVNLRASLQHRIAFPTILTVIFIFATTLLINFIDQTIFGHQRGQMSSLYHQIYSIILMIIGYGIVAWSLDHTVELK